MIIGKAELNQEWMVYLVKLITWQGWSLGPKVRDQDQDQDRDLAIRDRDQDRDQAFQDRDHPFRDRDLKNP